MKLFSLTIWMLVGTGVIAAQTRANDPQQANLPPTSVQRTVAPSAAANQNPSSQIATPTASPAPVSTQPVDVPPVPPEVTFRDGMITLNAPNSSLASVLSAISSKTGIEFEGGDFLPTDRIALSIGPASEADVVAAIFDGSRFDYVVLGRPDSPAIVQRVILTTMGSIPQKSWGVQPSTVQPSNNNNDEEDSSNAQAQYETPGERVARQRKMLEEDQKEELKLRELYLQQQKQQTSRPKPQVPQKPQI